MMWRPILLCLLVLLVPGPAGAARSRGAARLGNGITAEIVGFHSGPEADRGEHGHLDADNGSPANGSACNGTAANGSACNCTGNGTSAGEHALGCKFEEGAEAVAMGLIFAVVVIPMILYMALSEGTMSFLVLRLVDTTISIFLALLWFSAFSMVLQSEYVHSLFPFAEEVIAITQVVMLYILVMAVAYFWRDKDVRLMTLGSCGAHYVAFAGIRATGETQFESSKFLPKDYGHWASIIICALGLACLALVFRISHILCLRRVEHEKLSEVVEEMELDIIGLTGSFAITQAVRHFLTGSYPPTAHFLLFLSELRATSRWPFQVPVVAATDGMPSTLQLLARREPRRSLPTPHEAWQRWFMLAWAMGLSVVAAVWLMFLAEHGEFKGRIARKCSHVMRVLLIMCIAWGYLLWGEWVFVENMFEGHPIIGQMSFAVLATLCSLVFIVGISALNLQRRAARHFANIGVMGASLVAAWSWEHIFDAALDIIGERYQVGYGGLVPKAMLALVIPAAVLPVYVTYIKPKIMEAEWACSELNLLHTNAHVHQ